MSKTSWFEPFIWEWRQAREEVWKSIARLQAGRSLAGSIDQLRQLVRDLDVFVLLLRLDRTPSTIDLSRSFRFTSTWPTRDDLGKRLRALPHAYRRTLFKAQTGFGVPTTRPTKLVPHGTSCRTAVPVTSRVFDRVRGTIRGGRS